MRIIVEPLSDPRADTLQTCLQNAAMGHPLDSAGMLAAMDCRLLVDESFPPGGLCIDSTAFPVVTITVPLNNYGSSGLEAALLQAAALTRDLRHELSHALDRQAPAFMFDQARWLGLAQGIRQTAYRLWDVWIDGRLSRARLTVRTWAQRRREYLGESRKRLTPRERLVLLDVWGRSALSFSEMLGLAEELTPIRVAARRRARARAGLPCRQPRVPLERGMFLYAPVGTDEEHSEP